MHVHKPGLHEPGQRTILFVLNGEHITRLLLVVHGCFLRDGRHEDGAEYATHYGRAQEEGDAEVWNFLCSRQKCKDTQDNTDDSTESAQFLRDHVAFDIQIGMNVT